MQLRHNSFIIASLCVIAGTCVARHTTAQNTQPVPSPAPANPLPERTQDSGQPPADTRKDSLDNDRDRDERDRNERSRDDQSRDPRDDSQNGQRFMRPFALTNPQETARIDQAVERLQRREQRIAQANKAAIANVATLRNLRGDDLTTGLVNTLQQLLKEQQAIGEYLVDARSVWTGDMSSPHASADRNAARTQRMQGQRDAVNGQQSIDVRDFQSPFAFDASHDASTFSTRARQLADAEERLSTANKERGQQLTELRAMSGEQQQVALVELFQNVLIDQQELTDYLRSSRMMWSGEVDPQQAPTDPAATNPTRDNQQPAAGQRSTQPRATDGTTSQTPPATNPAPATNPR